MKILKALVTLSPLIVNALDINYANIPTNNTFILVVDKSGSMSGQTIEAVKMGALNFIQQVNKQDEIGLITFNNGVDIVATISTSRSSIRNGIEGIQVSGGTHLFDAIATGIKQLIGSSGKKILIYLTDGKDNGSNFSSQNLESMCVGENILVYGIGVGDVDVKSLKRISEATDGDYFTLSASNEEKLKSIYGDVLNSYYVNRKNTSTGELVIKSIPNKQIVRVNNSNAGVTPLKLTSLPPGDVVVEVLFANDRTWKQTILVKENYAAFVKANEKDASKNLWIISRPHGATVFIDGDFMGYTGIEVFNTKKKRWSKQVIKSTSALKISGLNPGLHHIELIGLPDFDYGPDQKVTFDYPLKDDDVISVDIIGNKLLNKKNKTVLGKQRADVFDF